MMPRRPRGGLRRSEKHKMEKRKVSELSLDDFKFLKKHVIKRKGGFIKAVLLSMSTAFLSIFPPLISKILVDDYIIAKEPQGILIFSLLLLSLYSFFWISQYFQLKITVKTAQGVIADVRKEVSEKIMHLPMSYHTEQKRGELLSIVTNNVASVSEALSSGIISIFSDLIALIGILVIMLQLSPFLTLIMFVVIPLLIFTVRYFRTKIRTAVYKIRERNAELNANVEENISGIREIQSFAMEENSNKEFEKVTDQNVRANLKANILMGIMGALVSLNTYVGVAVIVGVGGMQVMTGAITIGVLMAFIQYMNQFIRPISELSNIYTTFQIATASLMHINEYMDVGNRLPEPEDPIHLPEKMNGDIGLDNVYFSYDTLKLFQGLDLDINGGEKVGIVGETGAGKSTLVSLITRIYDVDAGSIKLDGIDIKRIPNRELRTVMAVVSQRVMLFSETIINNIRFSKPDATDEEVVKAAQMANAHDFIERLPFGYDTYVGEGGAKLSGGQRQLIAYARLLLVKPKIVILDEATSNIDSYTENIIQQNMEEVLRDFTTIIIAHRFATLKIVDRIVVMRNGTIQDVGKHEELLERNDYYQELCEKQMV